MPLLIEQAIGIPSVPKTAVIIEEFFNPSSTELVIVGRAAAPPRTRQAVGGWRPAGGAGGVCFDLRGMMPLPPAIPVRCHSMPFAAAAFKDQVFELIASSYFPYQV